MKMKYNNPDIAKHIIEMAFKDKTDKGGKPYALHCLRVAKIFETNNDLYCIALMHDLFEDCPEWNAESLSVFFGEKVIETIQLLTKSKSDTYEAYIDTIKASSNGFAQRVKIQDLKDNMDITRLKELTKKDFERLEKYHKAYLLLND